MEIKKAIKDQQDMTSVDMTSVLERGSHDMQNAEMDIWNV